MAYNFQGFKKRILNYFLDEAINLPAEKGPHFPLQADSFSPVCAASFPLSSFSFSILSGVFQMNSLFWPRVYP
jgi:hypothetical protein